MYDKPATISTKQGQLFWGFCLVSNLLSVCCSKISPMHEAHDGSSRITYPEEILMPAPLRRTELRVQMYVIISLGLKVGT